MTASGVPAAGQSVTEPGWDAVLLAGFGGPERTEDVMPFLRNVTRGRGVPEERLVEVSHHYEALGGSSPINAQNRALQTALAAELDRRGVGLPVVWGNRNWDPYLTGVVEQAQRDGLPRLLGLATSAYSSYSSCRQYREDFAAALQDNDLVGRARIDKLRLYWNHPGFLLPFADGITAALADAEQAGIAPDAIQVLFTTHSIPASMAAPSLAGRAPARRRGVRQPAPGGLRRGDPRRSRDGRCAGGWCTSPAPARRTSRGWSRTSTT